MSKAPKRRTCSRLTCSNFSLSIGDSRTKASDLRKSYTVSAEGTVAVAVFDCSVVLQPKPNSTTDRTEIRDIVRNMVVLSESRRNMGQCWILHLGSPS